MEHIDQGVFVLDDGLEGWQLQVAAGDRTMLGFSEQVAQAANLADVIAALQTFPVNKQNVWFRTDLDIKTQKVIASAIPVLISKNMMANDLDYKYGGDE